MLLLCVGAGACDCVYAGDGAKLAANGVRAVAA